MALGTALFLIAVGAILRFAVTASTSAVNIHTVGVILMIVGGVGLLVSLFWMVVWSDRRRTTPPEDGYYRRSYSDRGPYPGPGV